MKRETVDRANELIMLIENNKKAIKFLEDDVYRSLGMILYTSNKLFLGEYMSFEPWEVRLMIYNKKQRLQALEKELEELRE